MKKLVIFLSLFFLTIFAIYAEISPDQVLTPDPEIELGQLDNGLTY